MICVTWTRQRASVNMALNIYFSFRLISSRWLRLRLVTILLLIWTTVRWSIMFDSRLEHHHNSGSNWFKIFKNLQTEKFSFLLHVKLQNQKDKTLLHFHCKNRKDKMTKIVNCINQYLLERWTCSHFFVRFINLKSVPGFRFRCNCGESYLWNFLSPRTHFNYLHIQMHVF